MSDERLREILGFDPESGQSVSVQSAERSRLKPLSPAVVPSREIQQAFINWCDDLRTRNGYRGPFRIVLPQLFHTDENNGVFSRAYYRLPLEPYFSGNDMLAEISGSEDTDVRVRIFGEQPSFESQESESLEIWFSGIPDGSDGNIKRTALTYRRRDNELRIFYKGRAISEFRFGPTLLGGIFVADTPRPDVRLSDLLAEGSASFRSKSAAYALTYDQETGLITLEKVVKSQLTDIIVISAIVDTGQIFQEFIPKPILIDPIEADLDLDEWKNLRLATFGITWREH